MNNEEFINDCVERMLRPVDGTPLSPQTMRRFLLSAIKVERKDGTFNLIIAEQNFERLNIDTMGWDAAAATTLASKAPVPDNNKIRRECYIIKFPLALKLLEKTEMMAGCTWDKVREQRNALYKPDAPGRTGNSR